MKVKLLNLFLIGSIVISIILSSCQKDEDDKQIGEANTPTNETGTYTDSRDGKVYKWVKIGEQIWMAENLAYEGSDIQHITNENEWNNNDDYNGWSYYDNNNNYGNTYGALYQWEAAKIACPNGWHLPTYDEWGILTNYLESNSYSCDGVIGSKYIAKSVAKDSSWFESKVKYSIGNINNPKYRNKTGFSALPGGYCNSGFFNDINLYGFWWCATEYDSNSAYNRFLFPNSTRILFSTEPKSDGHSVRCIRD